MNKKGLIIFALILIFALTLPGCNKAPAEEHFAGLKAKGEKFVADYNGAIQKLNAESSYSYTAIFYSETLTNFDAENKKLPEKEEWRKVNKETLYIKNGGEEYIKVASGPEVLELWLSAAFARIYISAILLDTPIIDEGFTALSEEIIKKPSTS